MPKVNSARYAIFAVCLLAGCAAAAPSAPTPPATQPYVLHFPGIAGPRQIDQNLVDGLAAGGVKGQIEMFDWTNGSGGLMALTAYKQNRQQAAKAAEQLVAIRRADPRRSILLTGHSGGAAILVWALEALPADVRVGNVLLLAPALSPEYDLSKALAHVSGAVHVFNSPNDGIVLGAGTRLFGTMDGVMCEAAGKTGFVKPRGADDAQYAKLIVHPYDPRWFNQYGNNGDHIAPMGRRFARDMLAGVLLSRASATTGPTTRVAADSSPEPHAN